MSERFHLSSALAGAEWERAKGHLRALVVIQGSHSGNPQMAEKFESIQKAVETFIEEIESKGLDE